MENSKTDIDLINSYLNGDERAFDIILNKYQNFIYNIALRMTSNLSDAEDITQDVFITLFSKINQFEKKSQFSTWIYRITINTCYDYLKKKKRAPLSIEQDEIKLVVENKKSTFSRDIEIKQDQDEVQKAINHLPIDLKTIIILYDIKGLKYQEIADIMEISIGTVKSRINRARKKLFKILKPYWEQNR